MQVSRLFGSWKLVSWQMPGAGGAPFYPMGPEAKGLLIYAPDGYMSASLMAPGRPNFLGGDPLGGTPEETHVAMQGYHAYCGRYRLDGDRVIHMVEMCLFPNMIGTEQVRYYRLDGDRLLLSTPPLTRMGVTGIAKLAWARVGGHS